MSVRHVSLRQYALFEAVARHLSYSRAARELHVSQPAVSMQMRQLEQRVGLPLVEQTGRQLRLTAAGLELARGARAVLAAVADTASALEALQGLDQGQLVLAAVSTAKYFVPRLLAAFCARYPGITVRFEVSNREAILQHIEANDTDLVVMGQPPESIDVAASAFAPNRLAIVAHPGHRLAGRTRLRMADLAHENFLMREPGSGTRLAFERLCLAEHFEFGASAEMSSNETIKQAVMAGMGIAFLSLDTVGLELATGRLAVLPVRGLPVQRQWYVVHRTHKRLSAAATAFKAFLIEEGQAWMTAPAAVPP